MISIHNLLNDDEKGFINRLKLQKYVFLAQNALQNNFGFEYNIYSNGPYSPGLANYYYEKLDLDMLSSSIRDHSWTNDKNFTDRFLTLFEDKEPGWLDVAATLIDSTNFCENEQESLNEVYAIKSMYAKKHIFDIMNELKEKELVTY